MEQSELVTYLLDQTGMTLNEVSRAMGKTDNWARNMRKLSRDPRVSTVNSLGSLSGLRLALVNEDGDVVEVIEPDQKEQESA